MKKKKIRVSKRKHTAIAMQMHDRLYKKLCRSARANDLSIPKEIEQRINETFDIEAPAIERLGGIARDLRNQLQQLHELADNLKTCNSHLQWLRYNVKLSVDTDTILNREASLRDELNRHDT
jgi:hypothetical protein